MAWKAQRVLGTEDDSQRTCTETYLMALFGTPRGAPAFTRLRFQVRNEPDSHPVLLPHVFFSELFEHSRSLWEDDISEPPGAAREVWQRLQH